MCSSRWADAEGDVQDNEATPKRRKVKKAAKSNPVAQALKVRKPILKSRTGDPVKVCVACPCTRVQVLSAAFKSHLRLVISFFDTRCHDLFGGSCLNLPSRTHCAHSLILLIAACQSLC